MPYGAPRGRGRPARRWAPRYSNTLLVRLRPWVTPRSIRSRPVVPPTRPRAGDHRVARLGSGRTSPRFSVPRRKTCGPGGSTPASTPGSTVTRSAGSPRCSVVEGRGSRAAARAALDTKGAHLRVRPTLATGTGGVGATARGWVGRARGSGSCWSCSPCASCWSTPWPARTPRSFGCSVSVGSCCWPESSSSRGFAGGVTAVGKAIDPATPLTAPTRWRVDPATR
jgi:hypothetical protein